VIAGLAESLVSTEEMASSGCQVGCGACLQVVDAMLPDGCPWHMVSHGHMVIPHIARRIAEMASPSDLLGGSFNVRARSLASI
jgi:hypothetical protein